MFRVKGLVTHDTAVHTLTILLIISKLESFQVGFQTSSWCPVQLRALTPDSDLTRQPSSSCFKLAAVNVKFTTSIKSVRGTKVEKQTVVTS